MEVTATFVSMSREKPNIGATMNLHTIKDTTKPEAVFSDASSRLPLLLCDIPYPLVASSECIVPVCTVVQHTLYKP
jgi:hypothetical protein